MKGKKIDLVILAGGKGTRIKKFLNKNPKPLIKINKIPFLQILLNEYTKYPFKNIYILAGYRGKVIYKKYNNKYQNFVKINCIVEKKLLGTAGALNNLRNKINNDFILMNGDSYLNVNLNKFFFQNQKKHQIFLTKNFSYKSNKKLSNLSINKKKEIFINKGNLMNSGIYFFKKNIFNLIEKKSFSLEDEIIPKLIINKKIIGNFVKGYFIDIGTKKNLIIAKKKFSKYLERPAAFFDRDGVINHDLKYVYKISQFKFKKGIIKTLRLLSKKKYNIFVITNQAGIAKGKFTLNDFYNLHRYIKIYLNKKLININDVQFCPFHKYAVIKKYKKTSIMRKPNNGMVKEIYKNWSVLKRKSFFIGDQESDEICAKKSRIYFEYVQSDILKQIKKLLKKKETKN